MAGLRVHVVMPESLVARIDSVLREGESRGAWVRRAVEQALGGEAGGELEKPDVSRPAPAELPARRSPVSKAPVARPEPVSDQEGRSPLSRADMFRQATQRR